MPRHPLVLFAYLHALATLFRTQVPWLVTGAEPVEALTGFSTIGAALFLLLQPGDLRRLALLACVQLLDAGYLAPVVPNHWTLTSLVNLTLLAVMTHARWSLQRMPDHDELWVRLREPMVVGIAVFYWFTGFWKTNTDFLNHEVSCGVAAWHRLQAQFAFLPGGSAVESFVEIATLILEWAGPVLLMVPQTRKYTAFVFALFHLMLGLDVIQNFQNFSSVMYALLVFYLDQDAVKRVPIDKLGRGMAFAWAILLALGIAQTLAGDQGRTAWFGRWLLFILAHGPITVVLFGQALFAPTRRAPARSTLAWGFVALILLNGLAPWLGIKNRNSWQMYSNIRLEPDASNHLLLPGSLDLLGYQAETVQVLSVSDEALADQWIDDQGTRVTWYMLRWHAARDPELAVTYVRDGQTFDVPRAGDDAALMDSPPWLVRKLVWYRPVGPEVGRRCVW